MATPVIVAKHSQYTLSALNRWSVADRTLPPIDTVKALHIYDFDNTLFNSPLPNPKLWSGPTIGFLQTQDIFTSGGWWHDERILSATGSGLEVEEARAWQGWWNERVVQLMELSIQQKDAMCVLLTGRAEAAFAPLIIRMLKAKNLEVDMVVLKPAVGPSNQRFASTMKFKLAFFECLMETYRHAEEIRVYEDRIRHVKEFREYFMGYNTAKHALPPTSPLRSSITAEVIQVADASTSLDPQIETAEVQRLINDHNAEVVKRRRGKPYQIKKTVFYTGYLIAEEDSRRLLGSIDLPTGARDQDIKYLANNILITPRPAPQSILTKVGGLGAKLTWQVVASASFEDKIWALRVRTVPEGAQYYSENPLPIVVIALWRGSKPIDANKIMNWQPVSEEKKIRFETTVGEKVLLRVEEEIDGETDYESLFANKTLKRKHDGVDEARTASIGGMQSTASSNDTNGHIRAGNSNDRSRGRGTNSGHSTAGKDRGRGRGAGNGRGRGSGRGAGGSFTYRSLDGMEGRNESPNLYKDGNHASINHHNSSASYKSHTGDNTSHNRMNTSKGRSLAGNFSPDGGYDPAVSYEDFPPLQKQYQTPQQLVQQQFEQYALQQQQQNYQPQSASHTRGGGNAKGRSNHKGATQPGRDAAGAAVELQYF